MKERPVTKRANDVRSAGGQGAACAIGALLLSGLASELPAGACTVSQHRQDGGQAIDSLRLAVPRVGRPSLAVWLPAQVTPAELDAWGWLLELDGVRRDRLLDSWSARRPCEDRLREREFAPIFLLAADLCDPPQNWNAIEVGRSSRELGSRRTRAIAGVVASDRLVFSCALVPPAPLDAAEPCADTQPELDDVSRALVDAFCSLRALALDDDVLDTLAPVRVDVPMLVVRHCRRGLDEPVARVVRMVIRDSLPKLAALAEAHRSAIQDRVVAGARLTAGTALEGRPGGVDPSDYATWREERARARKAVAKSARHVLEGNLALLDSVCAALPGRAAQSLRAAYFASAFGDYAAGPWDPTALIAAAGQTGADDERAESMQQLLARAETELRDLHSRVRQHFVDYRLVALAATGLRADEWNRALARIAQVHAQQRQVAEGLLAEARTVLPEAALDAWDAQCDAWRAGALLAAQNQLAALDPDLEHEGERLQAVLQAMREEDPADQPVR